MQSHKNAVCHGWLKLISGSGEEYFKFHQLFSLHIGVIVLLNQNFFLEIYNNIHLHVKIQQFFRGLYMYI